MSVGVARQWSTWDTANPVAMVHLPSGFCMRFSAYSDQEGRYTVLGSNPEVQLCEHTCNGDFVRARVVHCGTELEVTFAKGSPSQVVGHVAVLRNGEWGLRFWLALEAGFVDLSPGPKPWREDEPWAEIQYEEGEFAAGQFPLVTARHRSTWFTVESREQAVFAGSYQRIGAFQEDLESYGYYVQPPLQQRGSWTVLRFNAQMHPDIVAVATVGTDQCMAEEEARSFLARAPAVLESKRKEATIDIEESRKAIRDVVSWNTLWDVENSRPTTVLTRNWLTGKFGGWGVWLDDMLFHALLAATVGDDESARANLDAALDTPTPAGNFPCLRTANQEWVDRSQPPIGAYVLWRIFELTGDRTLLTKHFPALLRAHEWWSTNRDGNGDGLIEYGSSPTGTGAFVHTKQAAMDESAMDNSPVFDTAVFNMTTHTLDVAEPGLNSLISLEAQLLARMADELDDPDRAQQLQKNSSRLNARIADRLWDPSRNVFATRKWSGEFVQSLAPTSFFPLLAGAASEEQTKELLDGYLLRAEKFWGRRVLPSSANDDPASLDNVYWRGRIWPPLVFLVWEGLRRAGYYDVASDVARHSWKMFAEGWRTSRVCRENYHRSDSSGDPSADSDPFYTWGALLPLMRLLDGADNSPWAGWTFAPKPSGEATLIEPGRVWTGHRRGKGLQVSVNGEEVLHATNARRLSVTSLGSPTSIVVVPASDSAGVELSLAPSFALKMANEAVICEVNGEKAPSARNANGYLTLSLALGRQSTVKLWG